MSIDMTQTFWVTNESNQPEMGIDPNTGEVIWTPVGIKFWKPILRSHGLDIGKVTNYRQFSDISSDVRADQFAARLEQTRLRAMGKDKTAVEMQALYSILTTEKAFDEIMRDMNARIKRLDMHVVNTKPKGNA